MEQVDKEVIVKIKAWLGTGSINIFGLPFAGKDTQANKLSELLSAPVIAGGDILRSHEDQAMVKELMSTGELFPTDLYLQIILPYLSQPDFRDKPLILSSVGRWHGEEQVVMGATKAAGHPIKAVICLRLDDNELWQRFEISQAKQSRGTRHDDAKHVIEVRLEEFNDKTMPVIEYYRHLGMLIEVDGHGDPTDVTQRILHQLGHYIS